MATIGNRNNIGVLAKKLMSLSKECRRLSLEFNEVSEDGTMYGLTDAQKDSALGQLDVATTNALFNEAKSIFDDAHDV